MTRPRCPKCQKYYVTQTPEQRTLLVRTAAAIKRSIQRELAPASPYRRYQCDICGHRWAILVATPTGAPISTPLSATRAPFGASSVPMRQSEHYYPLSASTTGVVTAKRPAVRATSHSSTRPGTLMAARHPAPSEHAQPASGHAQGTSEAAPPAPRRTLTRGGASSGRYVKGNQLLQTAYTGAEPNVTAKLASVRTSRWQDLWRSFLPSHEPEGADVAS